MSGVEKLPFKPVHLFADVLAFLNSYEEFKFYVFYDGQDAAVNSEYQITLGAATGFNFIPMGTNSSISDNAMECLLFSDGQDPIQVTIVMSKMLVFANRLKNCE